MSEKIIRLTESDLVNIVKRVIQEDSAFTFGDKLSGSFHSLFGVENESSTMEYLANGILEKVKSGDYEILRTISNNPDTDDNKHFVIRVSPFGEFLDIDIYYPASVLKHTGLRPLIIINHTGKNGKKPIKIFSKGFIKKIANLVAERAPKIRYSDESNRGRVSSLDNPYNISKMMRDLGKK